MQTVPTRPLHTIHYCGTVRRPDETRVIVVTAVPKVIIRALISADPDVRGLPMGVQLGFMGVQRGGKVIWAGSRGPRLRCGNFRAAAGGCHPACQMMEGRGADAAVRSWPAARFRLTAVIVSAGQVLGLVMRPGDAAAIRLRNADPGGPSRVTLGW